MQTAYVQLALLVGVFVGGTLGDLVRGDVSRDGLCTYTFRDVCVSQRMRDVVELRDAVKSLQAQLTLVNSVVAAIPYLSTTMKQLQGTINDMKDNDEPQASTGGAVYIRWGRKTCPGNGTELVYWGVAGGTDFKRTGGGANYLCLSRDPEWGSKSTAGFHQYGSLLHGAEYQVKSNNFFSTVNAQSLHDNDVPCAVCLVTSRRTKLMIPTKLTCPDGWTREYSGYLMTELGSHASSKSYVCMDNAPEVIQGGAANHNGALFYHVEAKCGSLPCPNYKDGWDITCVVCSK